MSEDMPENRAHGESDDTDGRDEHSSAGEGTSSALLEITASDKVVINRWPLILGVFAAGGVLFYLLQPILLPFVLGSLFAYLGDPIVDRIEERGASRTTGVVIVFVAYTVLSLIAIGIAVPMLLTQLDALVSSLPKIYAWLRDVAWPWLQSRGSFALADLPEIDWSRELLSNWQSLTRLTAQTMSKITGSGVNLMLGVANSILVPVVAFYLMRDWDDIAEKVLRLFPRDWQPATRQMATEADEVVGAFLRGQFVVMCALATMYSLGLWLVGLNLALLIGLTAGLISIVPYLGSIVGIVAALVAAYLQFGEWLPLLWVAIVFGIGQTIEGMVLTPILVGDRIGLHPVAVIFALMAGGQLFGFVGVVVALPVAAVIMVFLRHALQYYRDSELYGGG